MPSIQDPSAMTRTDLVAHIDRCQRLLANQDLARRLPDGGENLSKRLEVFKEEIRKRDATQDQENKTDNTNLKKLVEPAENNDEEFHKNTAAIVQKYSNYRVDVEAKVRKMYEGSLSEREIQKILEDIPSNYLLTFNETCEMEKNMIKERRKEELANLRFQ